MSPLTKGVLAVIVLALVGWGIWAGQKPGEAMNEPIKIGVITALTGDVAYWGESTKIGADLAEMDLAKEGINVEFIFDDAQLDPKLALNAAQKQINVDGVDAIYSEFNPAAIAVTSFLKDKNILHVYDAAPVSPLKESPNVYKTFTDFQVGCQKSAELLKSRGVVRVGVLKNNLEFGQLCLDGVKSVYGENAFFETFNPDTTDFKTSLVKLRTSDVQAIFVASFSGDMITVLKNMQGLGMDLPFVGTTDLVTPEVVKQNGSLFAKTIVFGLPLISPEFLTRVRETFPGKEITNEQATGLAYIHLKQIGEVLHACGTDIACVRKGMDNADPEPTVGFRGFKNHIADFDVLIDEFKNGQFVEIQ